MKRPVLVATIGFIIGIILGLYFKMGIAFIFAVAFVKRIKKSVVVLLIASTVVSFGYVSFCEKQYEGKYGDGQKLWGQAVVVSNAEEKKYFSVYTVNFNGDKFILNTKSKLNYGDLIDFSGDFKLASAQSNFGGFNYRKYLKTKGIYGIVTCNKVNVVAVGQLDKMSMFANFVRLQIKDKIQAIDDEDTGGLLVGILLGDKDSVSEEVQTDFKNSGLSHLLAVSGLHVNYVVMALAFALDRLSVNKRLARVITILFLIFFMYLTNFTESIVRAGIMGIVILGAQILFRKNDTPTSIALSMLIILVQNPYKLFSVGLQLSFAGTIGIVYFYPKLKGKVNDIVAVCLSAQVLVTPIMFVHFNLFSTHFLLANFLASPLAGVVIILGFVFVLILFIFSGLSSVVAILYFPLKLMLRLLILINYFVSNLPFATFVVKTPYWFNVLFFYFVVFSKEVLQWLGVKFRRRRFLVLMLCVVLIITFVLDNFHDCYLYFVDVGQGDCTLIRTSSNKTLLIDGGGSEMYDVGKNVLVPYLLDRRIDTIDYMMISHFDSDHCLRFV